MTATHGCATINDAPIRANTGNQMSELDPSQKLALEVLKVLGLVKLLPWIVLILAVGWFGFWFVYLSVIWVWDNLSWVLAFVTSMIGVALIMAKFK